MKKISYLAILLFLIIGNVKLVLSQATSANGTNQPVSTLPPDFIGWKGSVSIPLDIRHNGNYEINFYTDSIFRMIIDPTGLVGIGTPSPSAVLTVDGTNIGIDDIFLTNGDYGLDNYWHLAKNGTNLFTLASFASDPNIWIGAEYGSLNHYTSSQQPITWSTGFTPRMQIYDAYPTPLNAGFVGIGDFSTFTPNSLLHQHIPSSANNFHQITNSSSGSDSTDGFKIGITRGSMRTTI